MFSILKTKPDSWPMVLVQITTLLCFKTGGGLDHDPMQVYELYPKEREKKKTKEKTVDRLGERNIKDLRLYTKVLKFHLISQLQKTFIVLFQ